jgi:hypothetical protein
LRRDATVDEPVSDFIFSLLGWAESLHHFLRSPVLCEVWRSRVGATNMLDCRFIFKIVREQSPRESNLHIN